MTIDFAALATFQTALGSATAEQIDRMAQNPRMPAVEIEKRMGWKPLLREAVVVSRALAACPDAQAIIMNHIAKKEPSNAD